MPARYAQKGRNYMKKLALLLAMMMIVSLSACMDPADGGADSVNTPADGSTDTSDSITDTETNFGVPDDSVDTTDSLDNYSNEIQSARFTENGGNVNFELQYSDYITPYEVTVYEFSDHIFNITNFDELPLLFTFHSDGISYIEQGAWQVIAVSEEEYGMSELYLLNTDTDQVLLAYEDAIAHPEKPVIYLYPETETDVTVTLDYIGRLTHTYPKYNGGWRVTAHPDGTLYDENGREYYCLFWEGADYVKYDMSRGFCVKGEDTQAFLEDALAKLGLNAREANEFIIYWLPQMEKSPYNLISFQDKTYTDAAKLYVDPAPDTVIRVFMTWAALESPVELEPQSLSAPEREGFTVVEWGGCRVD